MGGCHPPEAFNHFILMNAQPHSPIFAPEDIPGHIPLFPLGGALMLPRAQLPLNIFEPRYLAMVRDALAGPRLIGMVQPRDFSEKPALFTVGGLGRITRFAETGDGRFQIILTGICRFDIVQELDVLTPYRQAEISTAAYASDFSDSPPLSATTRAGLEMALKSYLDAQGMSADWQAIANADDESLIHALASVCPFDVAEKQALLEAPDLAQRTEILSTLMSFVQEHEDDQGPTLH